MGKCISHITRKEWYRNCNKGCHLCFGYNCDMCGTDIADMGKRCAEVACFFCSFSCCTCECRCIKDTCTSLCNSLKPIQLCISRTCEKCMKGISNECDDMCECSCYCENPCIFRDSNSISLQEYLSKNYHQKTPFHKDAIFSDNYCVAQHKSTLELVSVKTLSYRNENQFIQADSALKKRQQLFHPNIVNLLHIESDTLEEFSSVQIRHVLFLDFLAIDLQTEFEVRRQSQTYFTLQEISQLIASTLSALSFFQSIGVNHEGLRLRRIFATQSPGCFKIADPQLFEHTLNYDDAKLAYDTFIPSNDLIFLSPDTFLRIANVDEYRRQQRYETRLKASVFTLGMIFLSLISLDPLTSVYDFETATMNFSQINYILEQSTDRLNSGALRLLLSSLLDANHITRFDFTKAHAFVQKSMDSFLISIPMMTTPYFARSNLSNSLAASSHGHANLPQQSQQQQPNAIIDGQLVNFDITEMIYNNNPSSNNYDSQLNHRMRIYEIGSIIEIPERPSCFDRSYSFVKSVGTKCTSLCSKKTSTNQQNTVDLEEQEIGELFEESKTQKQGKILVYKGGLYEKSIKHGKGIQYFEVDSESRAADRNTIFDSHNKRATAAMEGQSQIDIESIESNIFHNVISLEGTFAKDKKNGAAVITYATGNKYNVMFINDVLHGQGKYFNNKNQLLFTVDYKRNRIVDIKYEKPQAAEDQPQFNHAESYMQSSQQQQQQLNQQQQQEQQHQELEEQQYQNEQHYLQQARFEQEDQARNEQFQEQQQQQHGEYEQFSQQQFESNHSLVHLNHTLDHKFM